MLLTKLSYRIKIRAANGGEAMRVFSGRTE